MALGQKTGGRTKGTLNKATAKVKAFLDKVFDEAFHTPGFQAALVKEIVSMKIDARLLTVLLAYYAGRPAQAIDHTIDGTLSLAQLIAGEVPLEEQPEDQGEQEEDEPHVTH